MPSTASTKGGYAAFQHEETIVSKGYEMYHSCTSSLGDMTQILFPHPSDCNSSSLHKVLQNILHKRIRTEQQRNHIVKYASKFSPLASYKSNLSKYKKQGPLRMHL